MQTMVGRFWVALLLVALVTAGCGSVPAASPQAGFSQGTSISRFPGGSVPENATPGFPAGFKWGFATAGYQVEGGNTTSQWYFWELAGKTEHKAGRAVDFWNRYPQDLDLARGIGATAMRIGIEWSRIEPERGRIDPVAVQFYRDLIAGITRRGMTPVVTLLHFSFPQWLTEDPDGNGLRDWEDPETVDRYLRYVELVVREFGPSVRYWLTFNEPNIWVPGAYLFGATPPGRKGLIPAARAVWNVLQAHARAYDLIHRLDPDAQVSANIYQILFRPFGENLQATASADFYDTNWFLESLERGRAPVNPEQVFGQGLRPASTVSLLRKFDYVSFDYYYPIRSIKDLFNILQFWLMPIYPRGLYDVLMDYHRRFGKPQLIAENGMCTQNLTPRPDGWKREDHLVQHAHQLQRAIAGGANVVGYFYWSLMDNYEWGSYVPRCGIYSVDVLKDPTLQRVPSAAVEAYRQVIASGITPDLLKQYPGIQK